MRIPRLHILQPLPLEQTIVLEAAASHYVGKVLRMQEKQEVVLFNDLGEQVSAHITSVSKKVVSVFLSAPLAGPPTSPLHTHLGQVMCRGERMDYVIQKATELGAYEIQPIFSERSIIKISQDRIIKKLAHWKQVSISACEQCYRTEIPQIHQPQKFMDYLKNTSFEDKALRLILAPSARSNANIFPTKEPNKVYVLIGPEGGFDKKEIQLANSLNFEAINLGPRILRTETAPLSILSILQYKYGDFA